MCYTISSNLCEMYHCCFYGGIISDMLLNRLCFELDTVLNLDNGNSIYHGRNRVCVFPQRSRKSAGHAIFHANGISATRDFFRSWATDFCDSKECGEGEMNKTKHYSH